jgi:hypothetical protein
LVRTIAQALVRSFEPLLTARLRLNDISSQEILEKLVICSQECQAIIPIGVSNVTCFGNDTFGGMGKSVD